MDYGTSDNWVWFDRYTVCSDHNRIDDYCNFVYDRFLVNMNTTEKLVQEVRKSAKRLVDLTDKKNMNLTDPYWFAEVGTHMQTIKDIHDGAVFDKEQKSGFINFVKGIFE